MLSSEDLERFYFQYQTEAVPLGISVRHSVCRTMFHITFSQMVQGYPQKNSGSSSGWCSLGSTIGIRAVFPFRGPPSKEGQSFSPCSTQTPEAGQSPGGASRAYIRGADLEQWPAYPPERSGLSGSVPSDPKAGGPMLECDRHEPLLLPAWLYRHAL